VESGKPSLNLGLIVPHSLFREKQYRYTIYGRSLAWSGARRVNRITETHEKIVFSIEVMLDNALIANSR
jgi:hypothetical protein